MTSTVLRQPPRPRRRARAGLAVALALILSLGGSVSRADVGSNVVPDGRTIVPAGQLYSAGDFPSYAFLTPDRTRLYVVNAGRSDNTVNVYNTATMSGTTISSGTGSAAGQWGSTALSHDRKTLYVSGGSTGRVELYDTRSNTLTKTFSIHPNGGFVGEIALGRSGRYLYTAEPFDTTTPHNPDAYAERLDLTTGTVVTTTVGQHPLAVADGVIRRGRREVVAVANRDDGTVSILDALSFTPVVTLTVGRQPAALTFVDGGAHLLVLDTLGDRLSDYETATWGLAGSVSLSGPSGIGAGPSAMTVSRDSKTVYVALSADNAVAVVQRAGGSGHAANRPGAMKLVGRIPTALYPTGVAVDETARKLYIACAKGVGNPAQSVVPVPLGAPLPSVQSAPNPEGGDGGALQVVVLPASQSALDAYSAQVATADRWANTGLTSAIPAAITHVIYIIRENKTFDEEFGDEVQAGGSPNDLVYGKNSTPNSHALAERHGILQAYYSDEEVSDTGHQVIYGATTNDWVERFTQESYGSNSVPGWDEEDGKIDSIMWDPGAYILDDLLAHNVSFRDYGQYYRENQAQSNKFTFGPAITPALDAHIVHNSPGFGFDLSISDTVRAAFWAKDFNKDVANNTFPSFEVIYLPTDHTGGGTGATPQQQVADNDLATGQIVDAVSHSPYWKSTAVFVTEDDPQGGLDHIDTHRTIGFVVSPYAANGGVAIHYDNTSMLRTMEEILHIPPMTEFDATATPMDALFNLATPDLTPYTAITPTLTLPVAAVLKNVDELTLRLVGRDPDWSRLTSSQQAQIQWLSVRGKPLPPALLAPLDAAIAKARGYLWNTLVPPIFSIKAQR